MASIHLLVFVKAPLPGEVKTRLARTIGSEEACAVYRALARDTLEWTAALSGVEVVVHFSPSGSLDLVERLLPRNAAARLALRPQCEGDLGARLEHAFAQAFDAGARQAIAIGTDCALIGPAEVRACVRLLEAHDVVLGPAKDGGYYLIGLRSRAPELFAGVPWSSERVLAATLERARAHGRDCALLAPSRDLDTEADLEPLRAELRERWAAIRAGSELPFPLRSFRALEWTCREAPSAADGSRRAGRRTESAQADC